MKTLIMSVLVAMAGLVAFAGGMATNGVKKARKPVSRAKIEESLRRAEAYRIRKAGGLLFDRRKQKGSILFLNRQTLIPTEAIAKVAKDYESAFSVDIATKVGTKGFSLTDIPALAKREGADGLIVVIESKDIPDTMIAAPDSHWAIVNVAALAADKPDDDRLLTRVQKDCARAFAYLFGAADSMNRGCAMKPVKDLVTLDALPATQVSPEPFDKMHTHLEAIGVTPWRKALYADACREGWAPAPTNDVQKAIWDETHAIPKNPMKIEFDPKKGK